MKKIITILGTRPEIIRLSKIIPLLDKNFNQVLVHTGQNYNYELDKIFFKELKVRKPNYYLGANKSFGNQLSIISKKLEQIILKEKPDKFLVLGDTNSSLGAIIAARMNIPVFHMEAGNRSFIKGSPEEVNRKIIDHVSTINLPYTKRSCENLVKEGIKRNKIFVTGNPIYEVIKGNIEKASKSKILEKLKLEKNKYILCTMHRQENVDRIDDLKKFTNLLIKLSKKTNKKIVWPIHPRTRIQISKSKIYINNKYLNVIKPVGFLDFLKLEKSSYLIVTDSGTVQEEAAIFNVPCFVFREATERPETIENGNTVIVNSLNYNFNSIKFDDLKNSPLNKIDEYQVENVSNIILKILLSDIS